MTTERKPTKARVGMVEAFLREVVFPIVEDKGCEINEEIMWKHLRVFKQHHRGPGDGFSLWDVQDVIHNKIKGHSEDTLYSKDCVLTSSLVKSFELFKTFTILNNFPTEFMQFLEDHESIRL